MLLSTADSRTFPPEAGFIRPAGWMGVGGAEQRRRSQREERRTFEIKIESSDEGLSNKGELK